MLNNSWRKALRDLWLNKTRSILVILAITVGLLGVGSILSSYAILTREMNANYLDTRPASAILYLPEVTAEDVATVENMPEIETAEARRVIRSRIELEPNVWLTIFLYVIEDFDNLRVNTFTPEEGAVAPQTGELLIERVAVQLVDMEIGESAVVTTGNGVSSGLKFVGTVHDPGLAPAWQEGFAYGYITPDTLPLLGETATLNELRILVADNQFDEDHIRETVYKLSDKLEAQGYTVSRIEIPPPGEHPHYGQMVALLFLLQSFGGLALILSGVLVVNMISALLARQIRQIGVMKAIGGRTSQVMRIYFGMVLGLGIIALLIGMPLGIAAGRAYANFAADILNFEITDASLPIWVYLVLISTGLFIPLMAAGYPILRGSRITVNQAMNDYGVSDNFGTGLIDRGLTQVSFLGRLTNLALRNTFRQRGRMLLTLFTLAVGGAVFMVALNIRSSWSTTISAEFEAKGSDLIVFFSEPYEISEVSPVINETAGVDKFEAWSRANSSMVYADNTHSNRFMLFGAPTNTEAVDFPVLEGRWLRPDDTHALVVNHMLVDEVAEVAVGDEITLEINGQTSQWQVVGIVREIGLGVGYVNYDTLADLTGTEGQTNQVRIVMDEHDLDTQKAVTRRLEERLAENNILVNATITTLEQEKILQDHIVIIVTFLVAMALLVVIVGSLGLASTMSLNVLERTREIGVMRAIGASMGAILRIVLVEGIFIGLLSWGSALVLSLPLTSVVGNVSGQIFLEAPLIIVYSPLGFAIWFALVTIISGFASIFPALSAAELPVNQVLAYE